MTEQCWVRSLVLAPTGRDSALIVSMLRELSVVGDICGNTRELAEQMSRGVALAIIADEALQADDLRPIAAFLETQGAWSDLPVILLTHRGGIATPDPEMREFAEILGNVSFLERPFHSATLASMVRAASRNRHRQYAARARHEEITERENQLQTALKAGLVRELAAERAALSNLTRTLEERVEERTGQFKEQIEMREKAQFQLLQSQKMESVGQLTGGIAHDFNNLLMAVMGSLEILKKRLPPDPGLRRLVDGAMQGAKRGASLTQRMLAFARQQDLNTTSVDLGSLLIGMQDLLHRSLGPQIDLRLRIKPDLPAAEVHAHQVELAILNLAINARDAMPDGGAIDIDVDQKMVGEADRGQRLKPGRYLRVRVTDTGIGMDAPTLAKAIEPFFSTKPAGKGTGLGLSMTHGLAMQLGGALGLSSEPGKGTVATLWLPAAIACAVVLESIVPQQSTSRNFKVLIVDDDALVAMSTIEMLEDLGHTVTAAHSGKRALELLESSPGVDVLLTDHAMPGMTGIELAGIVQERHPGLPILLVTGYADLPAGKACQWPRLAKPYQQSQLQSALVALLVERSDRTGSP